VEVEGKRSPLLTVDEVVLLLRYSRSRIYKMARAGEIPSKQHVKGGKLLFDRAEIDEWIDTKLTPA